MNESVHIDELGRAADMVNALDYSWLEPVIVSLLRQAKRCISPFEESHIDALQEQIKRIISEYVENEQKQALSRAERGDFSDAEEVFGRPLVLAADLEEIDRIPPGLTYEGDEYGDQLTLQDGHAYGRAISDALKATPPVELFDQALEVRIGQCADEGPDSGPAEMYAVLGLSILASEIIVAEQTHCLSISNALEAAEAICLARVLKGSDETYDNIMQRERSPQSRGGKLRHAGNEKLRQYAVELYEEGDYASYAEAARKIVPLLRDFAIQHGIEPLSVDREQKTVSNWLSDHTKKKRS